MEIVWVIDNVLAQSNYPHSRDLDDLYKRGIRAIVSLEHRHDKDLIKQIGFEYLEEYVEDFTAPKIGQLKRINEFIDTMINQKKPVLIHCLVGSRSGAVIVSYLIHRCESFEIALAKVRKKIPITGDYTALIEALKKFEKSVKRSKKRRL